MLVQRAEGGRRARDDLALSLAVIVGKLLAFPDCHLAKGSRGAGIHAAPARRVSDDVDGQEPEEGERTGPRPQRLDPRRALLVLQEDERWSPGQGVYNLPKTKFRRLPPGQSGPKRPQAK